MTLQSLKVTVHSPCSGTGRVNWRTYMYRDPLQGSEETAEDCQECEGRGLYPPVRHYEVDPNTECDGDLQFPIRGTAECSMCDEAVRFGQGAVSSQQA